MSRAVRRRRDRAYRQDLRSLGCTCRPTIITPEHVPEGIVVAVRHHHLCPLGDLMAKLNRRGILPVVVTFENGCDR